MKQPDEQDDQNDRADGGDDRTRSSVTAGCDDGDASQDRSRRVIGIDGSAKPRETWEQVARIARATAVKIGLDRGLADDEIVLDDRYHAGICGIPDERTLDAMRTAARTEGMNTDPMTRGSRWPG